jgi:hypothetical protein
MHTYTGMPHHVARMVVGHSPQPDGHVTSACGGAVWRVDVGMSRGTLKSAPQALEILPGGKVRVLVHNISVNNARLPPTKSESDKQQENLRMHLKTTFVQMHSAKLPDPKVCIYRDKIEYNQNAQMCQKTTLTYMQHSAKVPELRAQVRQDTTGNKYKENAPAQQTTRALWHRRF